MMLLEIFLHHLGEMPTVKIQRRSKKKKKRKGEVGIYRRKRKKRLGGMKGKGYLNIKEFISPRS